MDVIKIVISSLAIYIFLSSAVYADSYNCAGFDGNGNKVTLIYDDTAGTVTINGQPLKIDLTLDNKSQVATENYKHVGDPDSYFTLQIFNKNTMTLRQLTVEDDNLIASVPLDCS